MSRSGFIIKPSKYCQDIETQSGLKWQTRPTLGKKKVSVESQAELHDHRHSGNMIFHFAAIFFVAIGSVTAAQDLQPRAVDCNSLGTIGNAASSFCSSVLGISTVTFIQSVTVGTISGGNPTIVYTSTSTKFASVSLTISSGTAVTHTQTKIMSAVLRWKIDLLLILPQNGYGDIMSHRPPEASQEINQYK